MEDLEQIRLEKRLPIDIEVFVLPNESENLEGLVKEFSNHADMIFMGLKTTPKNLDKIEEYQAYLHDLTRTYAGLPIAFVLSCESNSLENILE